MTEPRRSEPRLNTPTERALYRDCVTFKAERDRYRKALDVAIAALEQRAISNSSNTNERGKASAGLDRVHEVLDA